VTDQQLPEPPAEVWITILPASGSLHAWRTSSDEGDGAYRYVLADPDPWVRAVWAAWNDLPDGLGGAGAADDPVYAVAGAGTWPMSGFRADVAAGWPGPDVPPPLPPTEELPVTYILESTANDSTRGQLVLCDAGTVRVIGGGEKNALGALKVPKYGIPSATEWAMLTAAAGK
jgi:hypothetical protein